MDTNKSNINLVYNLILQSEVFPAEIVDIIFSYIYNKGYIILEDGKIIDYNNIFYNKCAIFVSLPNYSYHSYPLNYGKSAFPNILDFKIHNDISYICINYFHSCYNLTEIELNNNIIELKDRVFYNCKNLKKIKLSNKLECISTACFKNCINLKEIKLPKGLKYLCRSAFEGCINLNEIIIPESIKYIGVYCFLDCNNIESVEIRNNLFYINDPYYLKKDCYCSIYEASLWLNSSKLKKIMVQTSRKELGENWQIIFPYNTIYWYEELIDNENEKKYVYQKDYF